MMDMLIIIVVFLLKSYSATSIAFSTSSKITLPTSSTEEIPADAVHLIVEPTGILFDGTKIMDFKLAPGMPEPTAQNATYEIEPTLLSDGGRKILPIYDALMKARENAELIMSKAVWVAKNKNDPTAKEVVKPNFEGVLTIQADKAVRYDLLRKLMYSAGAAQFKVFKLISIKKEI